MGEPGHGCQIQRFAESPNDIELATMIFDDMQQLSIIPTEAAYSALIRCYCQSKDNKYTNKAYSIYEDLKSKGIHPKQRTFTSLLQYYSLPSTTSTTSTNHNNQEICYNLFHEMQEIFNIIPTEKEYISLLRVCLLNYDSKSFYNTLHTMMNELLLLYSQDTLDIIKQWFEIETQSNSNNNEYICIESIVSDDGIIQVNGEMLKSIDVDNNTKDNLLDKLRNIAIIYRDPNYKHKLNNKVRELINTNKVLSSSSAHDHIVDTSTTTATTTTTTAVCSAGPPVIDPDRLLKWEDFEKTLSENEYDIIIDGANVGYYNQNYQGAPTHVDYLQIHQMVEIIVKQYNKKPLLILHSRHLSDHVIRAVPPYTYDCLDIDSININEPIIKSTTITVKEMIQSWNNQKILYSTPKSFNDDWFWMYATIKYNIPVITNDEMRDHHFQLLSPSYFIRWRERHRVRYNFYYKYPSVLRRLLYGDGMTSHDQFDDSDIEGGEGNSNNVVGQGITRTTVSTTGLSRSLMSYNPAYRKINLKWPLLYSYRMQTIESDNYIGYYFPPVVHQLPNHAPLLSTKRNDEEEAVDHIGAELADGDDNKTDKVNPPSKVVVDADISTAELIENIVIDDKARLLLPWTCFYHSKCTESSSKRPRDFEDSCLSNDLPTPIKLRRQVTKSALGEEY